MIMAIADFFSGSSIFLVILLIIAIWIIVEINKFKHRFLGLFLIFLVLFLYISSVSVFNDNDNDITTVKGIFEAGKVYLSWVGSIFINLKDITANVISLDWLRNNTNEEK